MRACRSVMVAALLMLTSMAMAMAMAQAAPPDSQRNDSSARSPAAAHLPDYRAQLPRATDATKSPFTFKHDSRSGGRHEPPPPQPMDRAVVMGRQRPRLNGQPPMDCALTPMDAACR